MKTIQLKKGFSLPVAGAPSEELREPVACRQVGMVPVRIPFIKPRLLVETGDVVRIGSPLFEDKRNPAIRFVSPGAGRIGAIAFGPRRVIEKIVIELDEEEAAETLEITAKEKLGDTPRETLVEQLLAAGLWPHLRALPFQDLADPGTTPPVIHVRLGDDEPFAPQPAIYLRGKENLFAAGMALLERLAPEVVIHLTGDPAAASLLPDGATIRQFRGHYPAGNPWVQLYHTRKGPDHNRAWTIDGQDVIALGEWLHTGCYPIGRIVSVGGSMAPVPCHVTTRMGAPLKDLPCGEVPAGARHIVGGLFTGYAADADGFLGFSQQALNLIDDGDREEAFAFIRPGGNRPSCSTAFLSALAPRPFPMDCNQHGEVRACVNCSYCADICPVEILPQFTMKCLVADEVEEALAHGLLDCAECGLCTYVCPSKIELAEMLRAAKAQYYKESA